MNTVQLRYAKVVADTGSFSEAAQVCGVSQPTISNAVSELEQELGAKLFKRTTRRVDLTSFGRRILNHIEAVLQSVIELEHRAEALLNPKRKLLRIGHSRIIDLQRLQTLCEPFKEAHPDVEIIYKELGVSALDSHLDNEHIDVACGIHLRDTPNRGRCVLYEDVLHYLPRGGTAPHRNGQIISLKDVAREPVILPDTACGLAQITRELFYRTKTKFNEYSAHAAGYDVLQELTQTGLGVGLLPASKIAGDARKYPVVATSNRGPATISYEAVWDKSVAGPVHVKEFLKYLLAAIGPLVKVGRPSDPQNRNVPAHAV